MAQSCILKISLALYIRTVHCRAVIYHLSINLFTEPPLILETSGDQTVLEGETVSLWCRVSGIPYPKITWYRKFATDEHTPKEGSMNGYIYCHP